MRLKEGWRSAIGNLSIAFLLSSATGCVAQTCTAVGCSSAVSIEIEQTILWETTRHSIVFCIGTDCLEAFGTSDEWEAAAGTLGGRLFVDSARPQSLQWEDVLARPIQLDGEVTLEVVDLATGNRVVESSWRPRWNEIRPNGARCSPVCYSTSLAGG